MMTVVKIYNLEDQEFNNVVTTLSEGEHIIGRGDLLACNDKKVSRKHALINVDKNGASITSVHVNPCFYRPFGGNITILSKDKTAALNNDDHFALLPSTFWFKVKVIKENDTNENEPPDNVDETLDMNKEDASNPSNSNKRANDEPEDVNKRQKISADETPNRKSRSRSNSLDDLLTADGINQSNNSSENQKNDTYENAETLRMDSLVKKETVSDDEDELETSGPSKTQTNTDLPNVKEEPDNQEAQDNIKPDLTADTNNDNINDGGVTADNQSKDDNNDGNQQNQRRDKCWYGANCYRRNPQHRIDFSHPGDQDYQSDPDDDRPDCPFGAACYRTNIGHRRQFKHAGKPAPKPNPNNTGVTQPTTPTKPKGKKKQPKNDDDDDEVSDAESDQDNNNSTTKKKRKAALKKKKYTDTPEDDYDLNDSFINDGSSDEFEVSDDDDDDSDYEDSQEVDEESQETKRMLKEAKRFTKGKKKKA